MEAVVAVCKGIVPGEETTDFRGISSGTSRSAWFSLLLAVRLILHFTLKKKKIYVYIYIYIYTHIHTKKIFRDSDPIVFTDNTNTDS